MALPKQVQAYAEELDQYEKQVTSDSASPADEAPTDAPSVQPDTADASAGLPPEGGAPDSKWDSEDEKWEHKYRRLQGKYDAEVPRLHQDIKTAQVEIQQLREALVTTQQQLDAGKADAPDTKETPLVSQEDIDAFGDDLIDLQRRVAREVAREFQTEINQLKKQNQELQQALDQTGTHVRTMSFDQQLLQAIPDFTAVNSDPSWVAWLDEFDPMVQDTRRTVAQAAYHRGDVQAVKAYVDLWRQSKGASPSATSERQREQQRQVQPARAHARPTPERNNQTIYSDAEANQVFAEVQKLITQGRLDEAAALENEISAAYVEGRVHSGVHRR